MQRTALVEGGRLRSSACPARCVLGVVLAAALVGCAGGSGTKPRVITSAAPVVRETPDALQGTIGSMATFRNTGRFVVAGYGLVIGLDSSGSAPERPDVALTVRRALDKQGVGPGSIHFKGTRYEDMTPEQIVNDTSTSLVVVLAAIPPGLPRGERFDVLVRTLPGSATRSLEGGYLMPMQMQLGQASVFEGLRTRDVASAEGELYVNPFGTDGKLRRDGGAVAGRILGGGLSEHPLPIQVVLDNPDHLRARAIEQSINARFPRSALDDGPAARGRSDAMVELGVPFAYLDRPEEFLLLVQHLRPDPSGADAYAMADVRTLRDQPGLAVNLSWALEAIGPAAIPHVRTLYEFGEHWPRMAAVRAGARLGDVFAIPHLIELASSGPQASRLEAIDLLGAMQQDPRIEPALQSLAGSSELDVRVTAYEALLRRAVRDRARALAGMAKDHAGQLEPRAFARQLQDQARKSLSGRSDQGIERRQASGKFLIDIVPFGEPLVYVSTSDVARIAIFGQERSLRPERFASVWNDQIMVRTGPIGSSARAYVEQSTQPGSAPSGVQVELPTDVDRFVEALALRSQGRGSPAGLGLGYAQVVGVLAAADAGGMLPGGFATERDRFAAELLKAAQTDLGVDRPATSAEREQQTELERLMRTGLEGDGATPTASELRRRRSLVVPVRDGAGTDG